MGLDEVSVFGEPVSVGAVATVAGVLPVGTGVDEVLTLLGHHLLDHRLDLVQSVHLAHDYSLPFAIHDRNARQAQLAKLQHPSDAGTALVP